MLDIIKRRCPGDWKPASIIPQMFMLTIDDNTEAVINYKEPRWVAQIYEVQKDYSHVMTMSQSLLTLEAAADTMAHHLNGSNPDEDCEECGGTGKVKLLTSYSPCSLCGDSP